MVETWIKDILLNGFTFCVKIRKMNGAYGTGGTTFPEENPRKICWIKNLVLSINPWNVRSSEENGCCVWDWGHNFSKGKSSRIKKRANQSERKPIRKWKHNPWEFICCDYLKDHYLKNIYLSRTRGFLNLACWTKGNKRSLRVRSHGA